MGLFGRKKQDAPQESSDEERGREVDELDEDDIEEIDEIDEDFDEDDELDDEDDFDDADDEPVDEWMELDLSRDWRDDGPFDISEVDLDADVIDRVDLGALIVTPESGLVLQLPVDPQTQVGPSLMVANSPKSAMRVTLFAAPADEDFRDEIRAEFLRESKGAKVLDLVPGPFGTEIRRVMEVADADGGTTVVEMRDWLIAGPRWVLNARFLGDAALSKKGKGLAAELEEFVRNIVVRRGTEAMAPGGVVPLTQAKKK
ncbi:MAG: DUF3710 domain-containing protein [Propionibacteriaceae bacterium]|jgi:hypothetical protein|nr:DUF3710 domain-containing protein [Propionibacteriaceae bacterium]